MTNMLFILAIALAFVGFWQIATRFKGFGRAVLCYWAILGAGFIVGIIKPHQCPVPQPFSRAALKSHLNIHGEPSDGRYITSEDSVLWNTCETVCDPWLMDMIEKGNHEAN